MALGVDFFPGYVWGRAAALGSPTPSVVAATFGVFEPRMIAAAYEAGVAGATRDDILAARAAGGAASLDAIAGAAECAAIADPLLRALDVLDGLGRPLFSALRSLPVPSSPGGRLWRAAELVREHRGDGHLAALVAAGLDAGEANVLTERWLGFALGEYSTTRGFGTQALADGMSRLQARGWMQGDELTDPGRAARVAIEAATDESQQALIEACGDRLDQIIGWRESPPADAGHRHLHPAGGRTLVPCRSPQASCRLRRTRPHDYNRCHSVRGMDAEGADAITIGIAAKVLGSLPSSGVAARRGSPRRRPLRPRTDRARRCTAGDPRRHRRHRSGDRTWRPSSRRIAEADTPGSPRAAATSPREAPCRQDPIMEIERGGIVAGQEGQGSADTTRDSLETAALTRDGDAGRTRIQEKKKKRLLQRGGGVDHGAVARRGDHVPTIGRTDLTQEEEALLQRWIEVARLTGEQHRDLPAAGVALLELAEPGSPSEIRTAETKSAAASSGVANTTSAAGQIAGWSRSCRCGAGATAGRVTSIAGAGRSTASSRETRRTALRPRRRPRERGTTRRDASEERVDTMQNLAGTRRLRQMSHSARGSDPAAVDGRCGAGATAGRVTSIAGAGRSTASSRGDSADGAASAPGRRARPTTPRTQMRPNRIVRRSPMADLPWPELHDRASDQPCPPTSGSPRRATRSACWRSTALNSARRGPRAIRRECGGPMLVGRQLRSAPSPIGSP